MRFPVLRSHRELFITFLSLFYNAIVVCWFAFSYSVFSLVNYKVSVRMCVFKSAKPIPVAALRFYQIRTNAKGITHKKYSLATALVG